MSDIDWSKAPEGATHYFAMAPIPWRKVNANGDCFAYDFGRREWYSIAGGVRDFYVARPPASEGPLRAEEFDHLVEPDWSKAPEGATHCIASGGSVPWGKFTSNGDFWHDGYDWRPFRRDVEVKYIARPDLRTPHTDDQAVDAFAQVMAGRLATCRAAGKSGWDDPEQCPPQRLAEGLVHAMRAGKLVDVGNYAMMLWKRAQMARQEQRIPSWLDEARRSDAAQHLGEPVEWDGTGLPPVGTMVEVKHPDQAPYEALVVAGHLGEVVLWIGNGARTNYWRCDPAWLRPILTPEQRAAKERDEAVAAMLADADVVPFGSEREESMAQALYAAGWRKKETE